MPDPIKKKSFEKKLSKKLNRDILSTIKVKESTDIKTKTIGKDKPLTKKELSTINSNFQSTFSSFNKNNISEKKLQSKLNSDKLANTKVKNSTLVKKQTVDKLDPNAYNKNENKRNNFKI